MNRRKFIAATGIGLAGLSVKSMGSFPGFSGSATMPLMFYIGSYTESPTEGIANVNVEISTGVLMQDLPVTTADNPSFLAMSPNRRFLYAVNEITGFRGTAGGAISAFRVQKGGGALEFINSQPSLGAHPCHLTVSRNGKFVLAANYTGGSVVVLPVQPDGSLGEAVSFQQHSGSGPNSARQDQAHAHSVTLSPDNRFAFVCDLGIDKIMAYAFDENTGILTPANQPFISTAPGSGPRHFAFSPDGRFAVVVNELNSTLTSYLFTAVDGTLHPIQTVSTLPENGSGENTAADVHFHPSGNFVYVSNRGAENIHGFKVDPEIGELQSIGYLRSGGACPRNFAIDPSGNYLVVANQKSDTINFFEIDSQKGTLAVQPLTLNIPRPVCILMMKDR